MQYVSRNRQDKGMKDYTNQEMLERIETYVHSQRDREILKRKYIDGICYEPLGEEFGLSPKQIGNIVRKYQNKLFL